MDYYLNIVMLKIHKKKNNNDNNDNNNTITGLRHDEELRKCSSSSKYWKIRETLFMDDSKEQTYKAQ